MSDIIHLLPDSVANQIAAGEVIQRPASCLKELVENSLDAGATSIQILLREAGRTLMQVIDDGKGMSETDARMAFERHATSKIRCAADLFELHTMGFRGEALASICAVAQVEVQTRQEEDEMGTLLEIHGSEVVRQEPCQAPVGTNFKVKNLFFNVPARRRFLKTNATELRNILTEYYRIVLVNPQCQFTLVSDDEILSELPAGTMKQRIEQVFGTGKNKQFTASLVEIHTETELVSIRGFVGKPEFAGKNPQQFFFVNNRYMRHPYFHKAVQTAYAGMLQPDHNPSYFIYFDINPELIDVNIHPTKTEIKFADEQAIWQILLAAIRESLGKFNVTPSIDFESPLSELDLVDTSSAQPTTPAPTISFNPTYNPFERQSSVKAPSFNYEPHTTAPAGWEKLYETSVPEPSLEEEGMELQLFDVEIPELEPYQYAGHYICVPANGGLMFIDQRRAHIAIRHHELEQQIQGHHGVMQQLLFPETLELTGDDMPLMRQIQDDLIDVGFELEQLSQTAYAINSVPAILGSAAPQPVLQDILAAVRETGSNARDGWRKQIALTMAKDTAIRYGANLSSEEMKDILKRLFSLKEHTYTPDGKTIMSLISNQEIDKRF